MYGRKPFQTHAVLASAGLLVTTCALTIGLLVGNFFFAPAFARADGLNVVQSATTPILLIVAGSARYVQTSANDVGAMLEEQGITLGRSDIVSPSLADPIVAHETIRVTRVTRWVQMEHESIAPRTIRRLVFSLPIGKTKVLSRGNGGTREALVRYEQRDNEPISREVIGQRILRQSRPRVVAVGTTELAAFLQLEERGIDKTAYIASRTLRMVATAYTASCGGCSGMTASGRRAGHGIVAVDPRYIPLGTHLYIPGYGLAIAGDTGGSIHGNRIDLGFDSTWDAMQFGRRSIVVYQLK